MWVFGYGSLMWKRDFPVDKHINGYVTGFCRRFWQKSPDHRGTEELPGRTVTLVHSAEERTYGVAFRIAAEHVEAVRAQLDHRERAGYEFAQTTFTPVDSDEAPFVINVYIAAHDAGYYTHGKESVEDIADVVVRAHGASGSNVEYVLMVAESLRLLGVLHLDEHVQQVHKQVLNRCKQQNIVDACLQRLHSNGDVPAPS